MIKRITVEDFMAHSRTVLELAPGVTVITGPNNSGKSALVEAIRSIAHNPPYRHAIRHGAKSSVVSVELDSGEVIEWERSEKAALYRIHKTEKEEPETYAKFGRTPPDDVRGLLRLDMVDTETGQVDIHIGNQRQPIFLLDQSGSQAAGFFAASTEAEYLLRMQQKLKQKGDRAKAVRRELVPRCEREQKELERYKGLDALGGAVTTAETLMGEIRKERAELPVLDSFCMHLADTERRKAAEVLRASVLGRLPPLPEIHDTLPLEALVRDLQERFFQKGLASLMAEALHVLVPLPPLHDTAGTASHLEDLFFTERLSGLGSLRFGVLSKLQAPPEVEDLREMENAVAGLITLQEGRQATAARDFVLQAITEPPHTTETDILSDLMGSIGSREDRMGILEEKGNVLSVLSPAPGLEETQEMETLIASLSRAELLVERIVTRSGELGPLAPPPSLTLLDDLQKVMMRMEEIQEEAARTEALGKKCEGALLFKREEIDRAMAEVGLCPLCGGGLDSKHFLGGIHG